MGDSVNNCVWTLAEELFEIPDNPLSIIIIIIKKNPWLQVQIEKGTQVLRCLLKYSY